MMENTIYRILALWAATFVTTLCQAEEPVYAARSAHIEVNLPVELQNREIEIHARLPFQGSEQSLPVWSGRSEAVLLIERNPENGDLLYAQFSIVDAATQKTVSRDQWVSDTAQLPAASFAIPNPKNKKGLNSAVGLDDPKALGTRHIVENISIDQLIDLDATTGPYSITVDGQTVFFRDSYVENLDTRLSAFHEAGIRTLGIFLKTLKWHGSRNDSPLTHPASELDNPQALIGAFNLSTAESYRYYRAAQEFLAHRYTREDAKYGIMAGMIVGNEVQSHSVWYNMGEAPIESVVDNYHRAVRIAELAGKQAHRDWRVFVSLTHHWHASSTPGSPQRGFSGRNFIDAFAATTRGSGDFPWGVAWHPYPEDLFEPAFWLNFSAVPYFDSPLITMKNLEVLVAYLRQPHLRSAGQPREIVLSEQGFHGPEGEEAELKQAVALAYALEIVQQIPEVTAFHLHRHVDHPDEGGLMLGLRQHGPDGAEDISRKKPAYDVFKAFGEDNWLTATQFALDYLKRDSWEGLYPGPESVGIAQPDATETGVIDLYRLFNDAVVIDALSAKPASFLKSAGWLAPSIYLHPQEGKATTMTFALQLPEITDAEELRFSFGTGIAGAEPSGVTFTVLLDDEVLHDQAVTRGEYRPHQIDLSKFASKSVTLTLKVHPGDSMRYDWAHWIEPIIRVLPRN